MSLAAGEKAPVQPLRLWAYADAESVEVVGNRTGLTMLADTLLRGIGELPLDGPTFSAPGALAMSSIEITAVDGLIVVSTSGDVLRIEGDLERLQSIAGTIGNMLRAPSGAFLHAHLEPREYQGFARSSLSLEISKEYTDRT